MFDDIPLWVKILHTGFVVVLVPVYWRRYGPRNFLWFSDIALFTSVIAMWTENSLLASMQTVSVFVLETAWLVGFVGGLVFRQKMLGLTDYMFNARIPLYIRGLSLFHIWMPWLLLWMVHVYGYDRRALIAQLITAAVVLPLSRLFATPTENINWTLGLGRSRTKLHPALYLLLLYAAFALLIYLPTHLALEATMPLMK